MASAGCNFVRTSGPFLDQIPGKKVFYGRMSFQSTAGYDRADLPRVHFGDVGARPQDVFFGTIYIDHLILFQQGSEADNNQANQAGQGTGAAKAKFNPTTQRVQLFTMGTRSDGAGASIGLDETELATDTSAPYPLTSMTFECKVICGA